MGPPLSGLAVELAARPRRRRLDTARLARTLIGGRRLSSVGPPFRVSASQAFWLLGPRAS